MKIDLESKTSSQSKLPKSSNKSQAISKKTAKQAKLEKALRENLLRRKGNKPIVKK